MGCYSARDALRNTRKCGSPPATIAWPVRNGAGRPPSRPSADRLSTWGQAPTPRSRPSQPRGTPFAESVKPGTQARHRKVRSPRHDNMANRHRDLEHPGISSPGHRACEARRKHQHRSPDRSPRKSSSYTRPPPESASLEYPPPGPSTAGR